MEALNVVPDLERAGFRDGTYAVTEHAGPLTVGGMANGTARGKPTVMIGLDRGEDGVLVAQTTLALFLSAADALKARYGDPRY